MRNSSFLIGVWLSLIRNGPFRIGSELSPMRNSSFLIGVWLSLMRNGPFLIGSGLSPMRNSSFLIGVGLPLMRNSPFLIGSELSPMRNSPFLIRGGPSPMRNSPFLIRGGPSPMRNSSFLIRDWLPLMRNDQFLIWRELPPVRNTPIPDLGLPSRNEETAILHSDLAPPNHGKPACPRTAERLSRRVPIAGQNLYGEKHDPKRNFLQRLFANPAISVLLRFYRAQVTGWTLPITAP